MLLLSSLVWEAHAGKRRAEGRLGLGKHRGPLALGDRLCLRDSHLPWPSEVTWLLGLVAALSVPCHTQEH